MKCTLWRRRGCSLLGVSMGGFGLVLAGRIAFADHASDAFGAAGDEDDFVAHVEEFGEIHGKVVFAVSCEGKYI